MVTEHFRDVFEARRSRGMRGDVDARAWGTFYRLALNTRRASGAGHPLAVGQGVVLPEA
jgi:hypothetical protein